MVKDFTSFIGYWTGYDSSDEEEHENTILIQVSKNFYVYVGWKVYGFETDEKLIDFIAVLGRSDVPYPVAYSDNNVYFMLDYVHIQNKHLTTVPNVDGAKEMYSEFYGHDHKKPKKKDIYKMKNVNMIHERNI